MVAKTKDEVIASIKSSFASVSPQLKIDTSVGPFYNLSTLATAQVISELSVEVERVAALSSFSLPTNATDSEINSILTAFSLAQSEGGFASGLALFVTSQRPEGVQEITVDEGDLISTSDGGVLYVVSATKSLTASNADLYFNPQTRQYELPVTVTSTTQGVEGNASATTINRIASGAENFSGVYNPSEFTNGSDPSTLINTLERLQQKFLGQDSLSIGGLKSTIANVDVDRIQQVELIYSNEYPVLYPRLPATAGIDAYVLGTPQSRSATLSFTAIGGETSVPLPQAPVLDVAAVNINGVASTSFSLQKDADRKLRESTRELSTVSFDTPLTVGDLVDIEYTKDGLITDVQAAVDLGLTEAIFQTDVLIRKPTPLPIRVIIRGTTYGNFDVTSVEAEMEAVIRSYITNGVGSTPIMGGVRSISELRDLVRSKVLGIDSFIVEEFGRVIYSPLVELLDIPRNQYPMFEASTDIFIKLA